MTSIVSTPVLRVTRIVLDSRGLQGSLSPSIRQLSELKELSLSNNHIIDQTPAQIGYFPSEVSSLEHLQFLDLSSNRFSSDLRFLKYFPNLENLSLANNLFNGRRLCVRVPAGLIFGLMLYILFKSVRIRDKKKGTGHVIFSPLIKGVEAIAFLEKEDGLSSLEVIGRGGCGEVFKAELRGSNGKIIAIKRIIQPQRIEVIDLEDRDSKALNKKLRHRNLLPLVAHVSRLDCHLLVYENMKNGSLYDRLNQVSKGSRELARLERETPDRKWCCRRVGISTHNQSPDCRFPVGKGRTEENTHVTMSNVTGTVGYIAPEYYQTNELTDKCDIFSFGVILGVLVVGKMATDIFFQHTDEMSLVRWLRNVMTSENPKRAIDEKLLGNGYEEEMLLVLKIACFCTVDNPKEMPNSKDVRCMLSQIKRN
ncbi:hypothetical protein NE237_004708 [Protea cynaroides]|uniref:Protein kinase domain-containing protein n=1 Tax=Protea cynaroides TaxID=273540 RepID=A0A9Q0QTY1_9MAGN|nr:hypothetical protein NE237_004708 [Protea cynaroides]